MGLSAPQLPISDSPKVKGRVFYGWWIVFACAIINLYSGGAFFYGFTALFNPIVEEFEWSYALVSLAFSFRGFEAGILAPIVGIFVDRLGSRKLLFCGTVITGLGFLLFSRVHTLWSFYAVFMILALGISLVSPVVTMTVVARWFRQRRNLAMGFLVAGFPAGGVLMPAIIWLIDQYSWRTAVIILGIGTWLLCIPLALVVKEPREEKYSLEKKEIPPKANRKHEGLTTREVLKTKDFWLLSMAALFGGAAGQAIVVHQIPYMVSIEISRQTAGLLVSAFGLSNIAGRLLSGWIGDIFEKRRVFAILALVEAMGVLAFGLATSVGQFILSLIAIGIGLGGLIPLRPSLQGEFFGMGAFGSVQGLIMVSVTVGSMISPLFAGWMFDQVGSYRQAFLFLAVFTLMAVPTIMAIPRKG